MGRCVAPRGAVWRPVARCGALWRPSCALWRFVALGGPRWRFRATQGKQESPWAGHAGHTDRGAGHVSQMQGHLHRHAPRHHHLSLHRRNLLCVAPWPLLASPRPLMASPGLSWPFLLVALLVNRAQYECTSSRVCPRWPSRQVTLRCCRGGAPSTSWGAGIHCGPAKPQFGSRSCFQGRMIPVLRQGEPRKRRSLRCPTMRA